MGSNAALTYSKGICGAVLLRPFRAARASTPMPCDYSEARRSIWTQASYKLRMSHAFDPRILGVRTCFFVRRRRNSGGLSRESGAFAAIPANRSSTGGALAAVRAQGDAQKLSTGANLG